MRAAISPRSRRGSSTSLAFATCWPARFPSGTVSRHRRARDCVGSSRARTVPRLTCSQISMHARQHRAVGEARRESSVHGPEHAGQRRWRILYEALLLRAGLAIHGRCRVGKYRRHHRSPHTVSRDEPGPVRILDLCDGPAGRLVGQQTRDLGRWRNRILAISEVDPVMFKRLMCIMSVAVAWAIPVPASGQMT